MTEQNVTAVCGREQQEVWKHIPGHDVYEVSNRGRIRRAMDSGRSHGTRPGKLVKIPLNGNGYHHFISYATKPKSTLLVHRVMAEAFIPNADGKPCINHKDGNKANNDISNLEWVTLAENSQHALATALFKHKVTPRQVRVIRHILHFFPDIKKVAIARELGISAQMVSRISRNLNWSYV